MYQFFHLVTRVRPDQCLRPCPSENRPSFAKVGLVLWLTAGVRGDGAPQCPRPVDSAHLASGPPAPSSLFSLAVAAAEGQSRCLFYRVGRTMKKLSIPREFEFTDSEVARINAAIRSLGKMGHRSRDAVARTVNRGLVLSRAQEVRASQPHPRLSKRVVARLEPPLTAVAALFRFS